MYASSCQRWGRDSLLDHHHESQSHKIKFKWGKRRQWGRETKGNKSVSELWRYFTIKVKGGRGGQKWQKSLLALILYCFDDKEISFHYRAHRAHAEHNGSQSRTRERAEGWAKRFFHDNKIIMQFTILLKIFSLISLHFPFPFLFRSSNCVTNDKIQASSSVLRCMLSVYSSVCVLLTNNI